MARTRGRRERGPHVSLAVQGVAASEPSVTEVRAPVLPWAAAAVLGALLSALASWLVMAAPVVVAAASGPARSLGSAFGFGTQLWLLAHGAGARVGVATITLTPLGLTLIIVLVCSGVAGFATRQAQLAQPDDDLPADDRGRWVARITLTFAGSYALVVGVASFLLTDPGQTARALFGAALLASLSSMVAASRRLGWRPWTSWPVWARRVPRSMAAAVLTVLVGASAALTVALVQGRGRVSALTAALGADPAGAVILLGGQLMYLPNLVLWSGSWVMGAGISLGDGSVVSPAATQVGLLPAIPVLGAVPETSAGRWGMLGWLTVGVLAGAVAAWAGIAPHQRRRIDEAALVGSLSGVLGGAALTALTALSRGGVGVTRLAELGPRMPELFVLSCSLMGISGMAAGLTIGLLSRRTPPPEGDEPSSQPRPRPETASADEAPEQDESPGRRPDQEDGDDRTAPVG